MRLLKTSPSRSSHPLPPRGLSVSAMPWLKGQAASPSAGLEISCSGLHRIAHRRLSPSQQSWLLSQIPKGMGHEKWQGCLDEGAQVCGPCLGC